MAKTKTPFFSIGSRGTVGGSLTSQKRGQTTLLRQKPVPTDPYSLAQAYQRWDYRDYAYQWTLLTNSQKQVYRTAASRYHITGFSYWMRLRLKELTNLTCRLHLDEKSGALVYDSSRNTNTATIYGASPIEGPIAGAFHFDGINDRIVSADHPSLNPTSAISLECFFRLHALVANAILIFKSSTGSWDDGYGLWWGANRLRFMVSHYITNQASIAFTTLDEWHHLVGTYDKDKPSNQVNIYLDGVLGTPDTYTGNIAVASGGVWLGRHPGGGYLSGDEDNVAIYDRALDITEIIRHSERRYPV